MISVFVVSCPCALGVAIPLADDMAASAMERLGVFVRTATLWPRLRRVRRVIFDKTGTLTLERPVLENPEAVSGLDDDGGAGPGADDPRVRCTRWRAPCWKRWAPAARNCWRSMAMARPGNFPGSACRWTPDERQLVARQGRLAGRWHRSIDARKPRAANCAKTANCVAAFHFSESLRPGAVAMLRRLERAGSRCTSFPAITRRRCGNMASALGLPEDQAHRRTFPGGKSACRVKNSTVRTRSISATARTIRWPSTPRWSPARRWWTAACWSPRRTSTRWAPGLDFLPGLLATAAARDERGAVGFRFRPALQSDDRGLLAWPEK